MRILQQNTREQVSAGTVFGTTENEQQLERQVQTSEDWQVVFSLQYSQSRSQRGHMMISPPIAGSQISLLRRKPSYSICFHTILTGAILNSLKKKKISIWKKDKLRASFVQSSVVAASQRRCQVLSRSLVFICSWWGQARLCSSCYKEENQQFTWSGLSDSTPKESEACEELYCTCTAFRWDTNRVISHRVSNVLITPFLKAELLIQLCYLQ